MKRMKVVVFPAVLLVLLTSAAGVSMPSDTKKGKAASQIERGRAVYAANCGRCHGADGQGHTRMAEMVEPPDLSNAAWQRQHSTSRMITSVVNGRGQMPAFQSKLSKKEIVAAIAYVRTLRR
jgi:cytochrome c oxidase cbb3-type subunit 3